MDAWTHKHRFWDKYSAIRRTGSNTRVWSNTRVFCSFSGAFKVGSLVGAISVLLHRDQLEKAESTNLIPIEARETVKSKAPGVGQGFLRCGCTGICKTNACKCKNSGATCNLRCHPSRSCDNKN